MKKFWRSTAMTVLLFLVAAGLLSVGVVGGTQAALQVYSGNYYSAIDMDHIGVTLLENSTPIAWRNYGTTAGAGFSEQAGQITLDALAGDKEMMIGKGYPCEIAVRNTGTIDEYVRVTIRKYWVKNVTAAEANGSFRFDSEANTKITDDIYNPDYIQLTYQSGSTAAAYNSTDWVMDDAYSSECEVYYYKGILAEGATTNPLFTNLAISDVVSSFKLANVSEDGSKTIWTYAFEGYGFVVEAEVDAVQTHHARDAINSAWGTNSGIVTQMGVAEA